MYAINKCPFLLGFYLEMPKKLISVGVERGMATRMAQVVWPMMLVAPTNLRASLGSNFERFANMCENSPKSIFLQIFQNCCLVKPSKFVTVSHQLSHSFGHTPFHTHIN